MSEESSSPRIAPISEPPGADKESSEIASLRKEIIEGKIKVPFELEK